MQLTNMQEAIYSVYQSYMRAKEHIPPLDDSHTRSPFLTRQLLDAIGSPDQNQNIILVTGSKGKGSTSRFISSILGNHGYKVGFFTSPHLVDFNERIRINGKAISDEDFIRLANQVVAPAAKIESTLSPAQYQGPVGIALAIALLYFQENETDFLVIESGRGGRFDDVNVLNNEWAVVTPILEEHVPNLGPTIDHIIYHKLGIVKENTKHLFLSKQDEEVLQKINLASLSSQAHIYKQHYTANDISLTSTGTQFDISTSTNEYKDVSIPLLGKFQAENAATAIEVCETILGDKIDQDIVKRTLHNIQWPGRCEVIAQEPTVVVDGSINRKSAIYVKEMIETLQPKRVVSIIGVPKDKDYEGVIEVCNTFSDSLILSKPDYSYKEFPADALSIAKQLNPESKEYEQLSEAITNTYDTLQKEDLLLIIGTQTFIGNALQIWNRSLLDIGI
ncbi:bifunctional folylpolyglutamate synthase/dihydrofolate synthase [Microbacteriaceae bacterium 4G12]